MDLPSPVANQTFWDVSALEAGFLDLPDALFVAGAPLGKVTLAPSLSFLLQHSKTLQKLVFDLGIRKAYQSYAPKALDFIHDIFPVQVAADVVDSLQKGGLQPDDIDFVCLSHIHWDHVGDTRPFSRSQFLVGSGSRPLFEKGYPDDPQCPYASDLVPKHRTIFLDSAGWEPLGPFPHALDFFKDGSLYIVDAPGHVAGHINILARTPSDGGWTYLAGDSAHFRELISAEPAIAINTQGYKVHEDDDHAVEHVKNIHKLLKNPRVHVMLAHDEPWIQKNASAFFPGKIISL